MTGGATGPLAERTLAELVARVASADPAPGAGPSLAWTCTLAAALVEMASAVALRQLAAGDPAEAGADTRAAATRRRDRAGALRADALALADEDVAAYTEVMAVLGRRDEPGHGGRLRRALAEAADPPLRIVEIAAEVTRLAADAASVARGGVRGEAITAAVLAEAVVRAGAPILDLNLAGAPHDPRRARVRALADGARADLDRAVGG
jgi:formiminotetrahydrofolate cyclodeaminase